MPIWGLGGDLPDSAFAWLHPGLVLYVKVQRSFQLLLLIATLPTSIRLLRASRACADLWGLRAGGRAIKVREACGTNVASKNAPTQDCSG